MINLPILPIPDLLGTCMWYPMQGDPLFESLGGFGGGCVCVWIFCPGVYRNYVEG